MDFDEDDDFFNAENLKFILQAEESNSTLQVDKSKLKLQTEASKLPANNCNFSRIMQLVYLTIIQILPVTLGWCLREKTKSCEPISKRWLLLVSTVAIES